MTVKNKSLRRKSLDCYNFLRFVRLFTWFIGCFVCSILLHSNWLIFWMLHYDWFVTSCSMICRSILLHSKWLISMMLHYDWLLTSCSLICSSILLHSNWLIYWMLHYDWLVDCFMLVDILVVDCLLHFDSIWLVVWLPSWSVGLFGMLAVFFFWGGGCVLVWSIFLFLMYIEKSTLTCLWKGWWMIPNVLPWHSDLQD